MPSKAFAFSHSVNHMVLWGVSRQQSKSVEFQSGSSGGTRRMLPSPYSIRFHICDCSTKDPHQFLAGTTTPTTLICIQITFLSSRDNRIQRFFTGDIMNKRNVVVLHRYVGESNLKKLQSHHCTQCVLGIPLFRSRKNLAIYTIAIVRQILLGNWTSQQPVPILHCYIARFFRLWNEGISGAY